MKKSVATVLIAFLVSASTLPTVRAQSTTPAIAAEPTTFQSNVLVQDGTKVKVFVNKAATAKLRIRILDSNNIVLTTKQVNKNTAESRLLFNLDNLADGTYFVEVTDGTSRQVKQIHLRTAPPVTALREISLG